jgi:DNA-binding SARP family transcriptional activator
MEFQVLGPLRVIGADGTHIKLASTAQRRLMSLLVLRAGTAVSADFLADRLELSSGALRTSVSRLRKIVGSDTLVTAAPGYELRTEAVDAKRFEHLVALGRSSEEPLDARSAFEAALKLWRGEAYAEFAHEPWAITESWRLAEAHAGAIEDLTEILLGLREWTESIVHLEPLIGAHPLRDRPRGLLMRSLADSGRRVEALRAFQSYRTLLIDETGIEPSGDIVALERTIATSTTPDIVLPAGTVTFLLTDLDGSARLWEEYGDDMGTAVLRHYELLDEAITGGGGVRPVEQGEGESVIGTFARPGDALAAAVMAQQRLAAELPWLPVRMAVHTSEAQLRGAGRYVSGTIPEGERLRAFGHGGQILVSESTAATSGVDLPDRSTFVDVGMASLRTLGPPERLWQVVHPDLRSEFPPLRSLAPHALPVPLTVRPSIGVVGRESELQAIADATKRVTGGEGREVLFISGEAGLGKTTLVAEAARAAFDSGACVLFGHCEEDLATPYQLFAEALGHYVSHATEDQLIAHVEAHGSQLARLVPALATRIPDLPPLKAGDADTERYLFFASVVGLLATLSEHQSVVLVFDDLQWADAGSLQLLCHVIGSDQVARVLVLGAYRDNELTYAHPLLETLAAMHRQLRVARVQLTGLDDAGVVAMMEATAGYALDEAAVNLAHAVYRETDGNPFFVGEVLRHLSETGAIYQDTTGRWVATGSIEDIGLPASVREVIGARVARLGAVAVRVLALAAVIGRDFDLDVLARASDTSEDESLDVLDAAAAAALVRERPGEPGRYNFAHALIQHTLYADLGPTRLARAHRQVAEALEDLFGDRPEDRLGELARHWFNAIQPRDLAKALDYWRRAADAALDALAPGDALRYYTQALDLYAQAADPDALLAIDLGIGLGTAQRQIGDPAFRDTFLDAARRAADLGDTERLVSAALANDRGFYSAVGVIDADKVEILEMALQLLPAGSADRALVLATLCSELAHGSPLDRRRALADEAIAAAESSGDDAIIVRTLNHLYIPLQVPSLLELALARTADALVRAERVGDPAQLYWAAMWRAETAARAGDIDEMDRCIQIHGSMAAQLDQPIFTWGHTFVSAMRAQLSGDTDRAEQLATKALQIGTDGGQPDAGIIFGAQLMIVSGQRGTMSELATLIEKLAAETPDIPRGLFASLLAKAHVEGDRTDQARILLDEFATEDFDLPLDQIWLTGMVDYAEAAIECRDPKYAGPLFDRLAPWAGQLPATGASALGPVSHYLGGLLAVLGRYDEADAYFNQAAEFSDRVGAKFFAARTALSWGRMLAERRALGDADKARDLFTRAHAAAAAHGYRNVERRAAAALQGLG